MNNSRAILVVIICAALVGAGCESQPKPEPTPAPAEPKLMEAGAPKSGNASPDDMSQIGAMLKQATDAKAGLYRGKVLYTHKSDPAIVEVRDSGIIELILGRFTCQLNGPDGAYLFTRMAMTAAEKQSKEFAQNNEVTNRMAEKVVAAVHTQEFLKLKLLPAVAECTREEQRRGLPGDATVFAQKCVKDGSVTFTGLLQPGPNVLFTDEQKEILQRALNGN